MNTPSPVAKARVAAPGAPPLDAAVVANISTQGLVAVLPFALAARQEVWVELSHPILQAPLRLPARVSWCRVTPEEPRPQAGLELLQLEPRQRLGLRLIQAAELGCRVVEGQRTVGFVVVQGPGAWSLFDAFTVKIANLSQKGRGFELAFYGERPEDSTLTLDTATLPEAIREALGLTGSVVILPVETGEWFPLPLELPQPQKAAAKAAAPSAPPRPAVRAYHSVLREGVHRGFVAITSVADEWSLFDVSWREVATVAPREGRFMVAMLAGRRGPEDSLEYFMARDFLGAIALAFGLDGIPELDPPLVEVPESGTWDALPEEEDEEAPLPPDRAHHCVLDGRDLLGYVARTPGRKRSWGLYNSQREKLAKVLEEDDRVKIVFVGGNPEDSLEYLVARSLVGGIALAFELDHEPTIEPPL
ncbi:MAG: PilZ domain-containing protein [Planctomycetota bacterium]